MTASGPDQPVPSIRYADLEPKLRTGDLMLLHGASWESRGIENLTHSVFSHVGMIVRPDRAGTPLVWQTGPQPIVKDPDKGVAHAGAQLGLAPDVFSFISNTYKEPIYIRLLQFVRTPDFEKRALQAVSDLEGTPFSTLWQMVHDWVVGHLHISTTSHHEFCAQLVAETYQRLGLLDHRFPANDYSPGDFAAGSPRLNLLQGAELTDEFHLDMSGAPAPSTVRAPTPSRAPAS